MEDSDGVYNLAKAPIKNCLSDFIYLNYSGVPFYVSYLLSGPSFLVCGTKRDFFLPKIVFLCKKIHNHHHHCCQKETENGKFCENDPWAASGKLCTGGDTTSYIITIIITIIIIAIVVIINIISSSTYSS